MMYIVGKRKGKGVIIRDWGLLKEGRGVRLVFVEVLEVGLDLLEDVVRVVKNELRMLGVFREEERRRNEGEKGRRKGIKEEML